MVIRAIKKNNYWGYRIMNRWNKAINIKKKDGGHEVFAHNGVKIGNFLVEVDGYYNWWPLKDRGGYIPAYMLRALADCLDELNKEWDEQVHKELAELALKNMADNAKELGLDYD